MVSVGHHTGAYIDKMYKIYKTINHYLYKDAVCLMVFNATFNNISVISWRSVLLVEDPEKTTDLSKVTDKLT